MSGRKDNMPNLKPKRRAPDAPGREKHFPGLKHGLVCLLADLKNEMAGIRSGLLSLATKNDLRKVERKIMSAISDFAAKQKAFNDRQDAAIAGIASDVEALNDKIEELQNSPGSITPEDQALLNELETRGDAITAKLEALDALTPPVVPPV